MNIQELEKSILFSNDIAEELNKEAVKIDRRLYCFAYYRPKKLPSGGNLRLIYQQSLLNIHGLLRECGPPIFDDVISPFFKQYCVSEFKNLKKINLINLNLRWTRNYITHNHYPSYYSNYYYRYSISKFISHIINKDLNNDLEIEINNFTDREWELLIDHISFHASALTNEIRKFIAKSSKEKKQFWLEKIFLFYKNNAREKIINVLSDFYNLKKSSAQSDPEKFSATNISKWLEDNNKDLDSFVEHCIDVNFPNLWISRLCPSPALPLATFKLICGEARKFVVN